MSYNLSPWPSDGPVVILANSLSADHTSWDHVVERLAAAGFRLLRFDQPGHGQSSVPGDLSSTTFASMADDVFALVKYLGFAKVHAWIGVSMGAAMSVYFVAQHPGIVDKLIICDTISASPANLGAPDVFRDRVAAARKAGNLHRIREQTLERWFSKDWLAANTQEAARMRELMKAMTLDGFETCCAALSSTTFDLGPLLSKVGCGCEDALLIVGEKDADLPVKMQDMRAKVELSFSDAGKAREVDLKVIKDAGHVCFIDGLDDFCSVVLPFLRK